MAKGIKTGGRVQGTPNKLTKETRNILVNIINQELIDLSKNLALLDNKDRIDVLIKLMPFVVPKVGFIPFENTDPSDNKLIITVVQTDSKIAYREEDIIL